MQNNYIIFRLIGQLALNTKISDITKVILSFVNFKKDLNIFKKLENN